MDDILMGALTVVGLGCVFLAIFLCLFVADESGRRSLVAGLLLSTGLALLATLFY